MANEFYDHGAVPATGSSLSSATMRAEFDAIEAGFDRLPTLTGQANKLVKVNAGATALETTDAPDINGGTIDGAAIGGTTPSSGAFTTLTSSGTTTLNGTTVPASATLVTTTATQTLTDKTLNLASNTLVATSAQLAAALTDETGTGAAVFAGSPALTGTPTAPTATAGTSTTQLATTAFVVTAVTNERSATATLTNKTISGGTISGIVDLAVADGGTGASNAADARANLQAVGYTATTGSAMVPVGTTAQRDAVPAAGHFRFNATLNQFEGYNGSAWGAVGGGATGAAGNAVFYENEQTVTADYTIGAGKNAMSAGPITINDGVTVTIPDGSRWVVS